MHWETRPDGTVTAKAATGRYTIRNLRLNRPRLNKRRAEAYKDQQRLAQILRETARRRGQGRGETTFGPGGPVWEDGRAGAFYWAVAHWMGG